MLRDHLDFSGINSPCDLDCGGHVSRDPGKPQDIAAASAEVAAAVAAAAVVELTNASSVHRRELSGPALADSIPRSKSSH
jgi:hypothetical protein